MPKRPNILFLLSDEHSYRFVSRRAREDGGEPCRTPTIDTLAGAGVFFETAYCQMPLCTPSRICHLTGRHSHRCGAWGNESILRPELATMASALGGAGYRTASIGKMHLGGRLQYAGFQERPYGDFGGPCAHQTDPLGNFGDSESSFLGSMRNRTSTAGLSEIPESMHQEQVVTREAASWLREHAHAQPDQPWMLYCSFSRPHFPLTAPRRFFERYWPDGVTPPRVGKDGDAMDHPMTRGAIKGFETEAIGDGEMMRARAAYFACVDYLDEILNDFMALLERGGFLRDTIVVYASDHGEMAGEHGLLWKNVWHEASTRVPLVISLPEHRQGDLPAAAVKTPVSLADLFPTLCALAGAEPPEGLDGVDLSPLLRGESCPALERRPGVIIEALSPRWGEGTEFRMIRSDRYKYVAFRGCEDLAFDLQEDPDEQRNLIGTREPADAAVSAELERLCAAALEGFDFDAVEALRLAEEKELAQRYSARVKPRTPNQIFLGDGRLVEADAPLYMPHVVSENPDSDFGVE